MPDYRFEFISGEGAAGAIPTSPSGTTAKTTVKTSPSTFGYSESGRTFGQGFAKRAVVGGIERFVASPLNQATGGMASPIYQIGRAVALKSGSAVIGSSIAMLALSGVMLAVNAIKDRMSKLESEAKSKNEREVLLLRAGYTSHVRTFEANFFNGVQKTNRGA